MPGLNIRGRAERNIVTTARAQAQRDTAEYLATLSGGRPTDKWHWIHCPAPYPGAKIEVKCDVYADSTIIAVDRTSQFPVEFHSEEHEWLVENILPYYWKFAGTGSDRAGEGFLGQWYSSVAVLPEDALEVLQRWLPAELVWQAIAAEKFCTSPSTQTTA